MFASALKSEQPAKWLKSESYHSNTAGSFQSEQALCLRQFKSNIRRQDLCSVILSYAMQK